MRVVLDTNVFVSGVFFRGVPGRILEAWRDGTLTLLVSVSILEEYYRVGRLLAAEYEGVDLEPFLALVAVNVDIVDAPDLPKQVCEDPDDDKFLACALAGAARSWCRATRASEGRPAGAGSRFSPRERSPTASWVEEVRPVVSCLELTQARSATLPDRVFCVDHQRLRQNDTLMTG